MDEHVELAALRRRIVAAPPRCGEVRVVCVDGPAGSGKTTLAGELAEVLGGTPVVHLDDLYQGWEQQLGEPLSGRLRAWLLDAWAVGLPGRYLRFDWEASRYVEWVSVPPAAVVVVEGCGSAAAGIRSSASLVVWVEAPAAARLVRGVARDGEALRERWVAWQGAESAHFRDDGTREAADVVVRWDAQADDLGRLSDIPNADANLPDGAPVLRRSIAFDAPP